MGRLVEAGGVGAQQAGAVGALVDRLQARHPRLAYHDAVFGPVRRPVRPLRCRVAGALVWPLGPPERARETLRRRLCVRPDSPADARLLAAMRELLDERDGQLEVRGATTTEIGFVRWATRP